LAKEFTNTAVKASNDSLEAEECNELNDKTYTSIGEKRRKLKEKSFAFGNTNSETVDKTDSNIVTEKPTQRPKQRGRPKISKLNAIL